MPKVEFRASHSNGGNYDLVVRFASDLRCSTSQDSSSTSTSKTGPARCLGTCLDLVLDATDTQPQHGRMDRSPKLVLSFSAIVWLFLLACVLVVVLIHISRSSRASRWKAQEVTFTFGGMTTRLIPDDEVASIAHQAWTELITRKAGIQVDDDDIVVEVHDSWYSLFRALRLLAKEVPVSALHKSSDAKELLDTLIAVMNEVLRPHLTKHQARYRDWWRTTSDSNHSDLPPQERQREYPQYQELFSEMREVNRSLIILAETLRRLAHERDIESFHVRLIRLIHPRYNH